MTDPDMTPAPHATAPPRAGLAARLADRRAANAPNWRGVWTLYEKEVRRFAGIYVQTLLAPVVTTLLFLTVFSLALGRAVTDVWGVPFAVFLAPGLVMMSIAQNAFANTSSSLVMGKVQGNIVDLLMTPLRPGELVLGYALAGATRGVMVGAAVALAMWCFVPLPLAHPLLALLFGLGAALMLSLTGLIGGIWAGKFDHLGAITNFVITPLAFLSGTFYSIDRLPPTWYAISQGNPFFYMIDGFRYGFLGRSDSSVWIAAAVLAAVNAALWLAALVLLRSGYRLKT